MPDTPKPRPFSVGTKVRVIDRPASLCRVLFSEFGEVCIDTGDAVLWEWPYDLTHASDGAPLGEWEPVSEEVFEAAMWGADGLPVFNVVDHRARLNELLREASK